MRRPVVFTPRLMVQWLEAVAASRGIQFLIDLNHKEGDWVGAGEPLLYLTGSFYHLVDLETIYLQKLGAACVAAYNAFTMCMDLPHVAFLAMDARHCAGIEMEELMAYAASVGSAAARAELGAKGFIGNANDATAHYFGCERGLGTMPHALIGYAGSTVRAAEMFVETFPDDNMTVLVDYFGQELTDALAVCRRFPEMAAQGRLGVRLDTHGGRFVEGLDPQESYAVLERHAPIAVRRYRNDTELRYLTGTGRFGRRGVSHARATGRGGLRPGENRRQLRVQRGQVQGHGRRGRAHRHHRHGLLPSGQLARNLCHRRYRRVRRCRVGKSGP